MNDLRFAWRQLLKNPGFTAVVVLTLVLGIGANTAVFSFLDRVFWRPLPVREPQELVILKHRSQTGYQGDAFIYPFYVSLRDQSQEVFSGLVAYSLALANLGVGDGETEAPAMAVSSDYFSVLGVKPVLGRTFLPEEDRVPGAHPVAVISHELWQRQMDGDPAVIGRTVRLNDRSLTVVGVAPRASIRFVTLAQAINRTRPVTAWSNANSPQRFSSIQTLVPWLPSVTKIPVGVFCGVTAWIRSVRTRSAASARSGLTPGLSRPIRFSQSYMRSSSEMPLRCAQVASGTYTAGPTPA